MIQDLQTYISTIESIRPESFIFRGVSRVDYTLQPKIARYPGLIGLEAVMTDEFRRRAHRHIKDNINIEDDWQLLAMAQHFGLPTRLLDWTQNSLVALYFSAANDLDSDGCVYAVDAAHIDNIDNIKENEGFKILTADLSEYEGEIFLYYPSHVDERLVNQSGLFTYHKNFDKDAHQYFNDAGLQTHRFIIPSAQKPSIIKSLDQVGVNKRTLFPSLDSICEYLQIKYIEMR